MIPAAALPYLKGNSSMEKESKPECVVETVPEDPLRPDGPTDLYLILDGKRIAKRGKPSTRNQS